MSYADTMRIWSDINCTLASLASFGQQKAEGVPTGAAVSNLFGNVANGFARNEVAYMMQEAGNPYGNAVNTFAGYGNPASNMIGTMALMNACTPWTFFNMGMCCYPMGGYYGAPMFGMTYPMCGMPMMGFPMYGVYGIC
jgi:hypothetical protein